MKVIKRGGIMQDFDENKIYEAIKGAFKSSDVYIEDDALKAFANKVSTKIINDNIQNVENIQDIVEKSLVNNGYFNVAKHYITYRYEHALEREKKKDLNERMLSILQCEDVQNSNANVDEYTFSGRNHECAGLVMKQLAMDKLLRKEVADAFKNNYIYIHDFDNYAVGMHNCLFIDFKYLFENGFSTRNGDVRPPKSLSTAMQQVAVIMQCQSQVQFGGVASMHIDYDLAPFVKLSFVKHYKTGLKWFDEVRKDEIDYEIEHMLNNISYYHINDSEFEAYNTKAYKYAMEQLEKEGFESAQALYHNLNTLESRAGAQLPFSSLNFGRDISPEGRLVTRWLLQASIDGIGKHHRTPIFPITIFQLKKGVNEQPSDPNYDLYRLALISTSKRLYPNYINGDCANACEDEDNPDTYMCSMGCRTLIGKDRHGLGKVKLGRGNITPITIVLPKIAIEYGICQGKRETPDLEGFWKKLDEILAITEQGLLDRFYHIAGQSPKSAPFMYANGTMKGAIDCTNNTFDAVKHGTNAIGFIGLAETLQALFGKNHVDEETRKFGIEIVKHIYDFSKAASERNDLNFSCYFTPAEGCCYSIMQKLKKEFGNIANVTENEYLTNSIHVPVWEKVSVFDKIDIESEFCDYGTAGNITYVEFDSKVKNNLRAIDQTIKYALDKGITYLAINHRLDFCNDCGLGDDIDDICPNCGSENIEHLARVTGYLSTDISHFNKGKQQEVAMRYKHSKKTIFNDSQET